MEAHLELAQMQINANTVEQVISINRADKDVVGEWVGPTIDELIRSVGIDRYLAQRIVSESALHTLADALANTMYIQRITERALPLVPSLRKHLLELEKTNASVRAGLVDILASLAGEHRYVAALRVEDYTSALDTAFLQHLGKGDGISR